MSFTHNLVISFFAALILFAPLSEISYGNEAEWVPWNFDNKDLHLTYKGDDGTDNLFKSFLLNSIIVFQKFISPIDGDRCPMYPTCSAYGIRVIKKHGPFIGFFMTADRLMHELGEQKYAPLVKKYGRYRFYDPIENNDFWFTEKE